MRRKRIAAIGSLILSASLVAACGGSGTNVTTQPGTGTSSSQTTDGTTTESSSNTNDTSSEPGIDTSEKVNLTMYLLGDRTTDFDTVYGEINKILEEEVNATVDVEFLSWGEHDQKYSLLFSGGEEFDLIFTASGWAHYEQTAALGGFYELTDDFIQTHAPGIWDTVPEVAWNQARINGKVYMVPNTNSEFGQDVMAVRGDLMENYDIDDITTWDDLVEFFKAVGENEEGMYATNYAPFYQFFQSKGLTIVGGTPHEFFFFDTQNPANTEVTYVGDWDLFKNYADTARELFLAGAWSQDSIVSTEDRQTGLINGTMAAMGWNLGSCLTYGKEANNKNPDFNVTIIDSNSSLPKKVNPYINNGVAINHNSKNKERAMMVLNEFYTNPNVYDLAHLGIEGVHWEAVGDDQYKVLEADANYGVGRNCNWGWNNENIMRTQNIESPTPIDEKHDALLESWKNNIKEEHPLDGFTFDNQAVSAEVAAVQSLYAQYFEPLVNGFIEDVDGGIEVFKQNMEAAGVRRIQDELQRQIDEYLGN